MNGVRRLLGTASSSSPSSQPPDPTSPQSSVQPLFSSKTYTATNWPSQEETQSQGFLGSSPKPTAGLFLKKDKPKPSLANSNEAYDRSWDSVRNPSHAQQPSISSTCPHYAHHENVKSPGLNSPSSTTSSPRRISTNHERNLSRKSTDQPTDSTWLVKRNSSTRDDLLLSLMASEAVVDARGYDVLNTDEVEELKKEHAALSSSLATMSNKLAIETKIRDAAVSLSKVNSAHKMVSMQSEEQLEAANRRVDTAQREVWRLSERMNEVGRRLLEHRAAVLSISVRNMEKKMSPSNSSEDSGYDSSNRSTLMSPDTAVSSFSVSSSKQSKFDGAHLFAGHENTIVPRKRMSPESASKEIMALEEKLKAATTSLAESSRIQAEMKKELSHLQLEKKEVETMMGMELQTAEVTIASLEQELPRLETMEKEVKALKQEQAMWEEERQRLENYEKEASILRARLQELEIEAAERTGAETTLNDVRESHRQEMTEKEAQLQQLKEELEEQRAGWEQDRNALEDEKETQLQRLKEELEEERAGRERDRNALEDEKMDDLAQLHQEMDRLREQDEQVLQQANKELNTTLNSLRKIVQDFNIPLGNRDSQTSSMQHLLKAIVKKFDSLYGRLEQLEKSGDDLNSKTRQLEADLRSALDKQESMSKELEETKKERDAARRETMSASARSTPGSPESRKSKADSIRSSFIAPASLVDSVTPETTEYGPEVEGSKFIAALQPLWSILPSPEARASKFSANNARSYRGSPSSGNAPLPGGSSNSSTNKAPTSLSELDVRSLKTLYDPRQQANAPSPPEQFTLENFIARVNALIADDRALIERLLRFAQAHDLLKKNAERAQKLAQDGNVALETYQKQVKLLETRNSSFTSKASAMQDEMRDLHDAIERVTAEKHQLEAFAAEQAETCRQLSEANNTLSARALTLAEEAATAPEMVRKQLDECKRQLEETKKLLDEKNKELKAAGEELDAMIGAEQTQKIALLDELNTMQTENSQLRAQMRAAKGGR